MDVLHHYIAKIEGHGKLEINFKKNKINLIIDEGERLIEGILLNRPYYDAPFVTSRICGVCPIAHNLASLSALENALKIEISPLTKKLRRLMICAQIIQSHTLHLYFLALSDYFKSDSTLSLAESHPELFSEALKLKQFSDHLADAVAGRNVHPIATAVGGFLSIPNKKILQSLYNQCHEMSAIAQKTIKLFASFSYPKLSNPTIYLSLSANRNYAMISDKVESSTGETFHIKNYTKNIIETVRNDSPSKYSQYKNNNFLVGALARVSLKSNRLMPQASKIHKTNQDKLGAFPAYNSFHNNYAQSVEILHFIEEAQSILEKLIDDKKYIFKPAEPIKLKACEGRGVIEAPRGLLYHYYELDKSGNIKNCNIITPTAQSLNNLEQDAQILLDNIADLSQKEKIRLLEMLIRAYDPCITCSVH